MKLRPVDTRPLLDDMWNFYRYATPHSTDENYLKNGALRHGKTLWFKDGQGRIWHWNGLYSSCLGFILGYAQEQERHLGYAYIHCLEAGQCIDKHSDNLPYHSTIDRYQVYLNWPDGCGYEYDGELMPNHLLWFDHTKEHAFWNKGKDPWYMLVFDLLK